ncbi:MAG: hypothetical protein AAGC57_00055 [Pseudomonadota bacterium]
MYDGDSFFTLSAAAQAGLMVLSGGLSTLLLVGLRFGIGLWAARPGLAALIGVLAWWAFLWLSPQVYYLYYQAVIPDLPWQVVVGWPPGPIEVLQLLVFAERPSLSAHARGALGWACLAIAVWSAFRPPKSRRSR